MSATCSFMSATCSFMSAVRFCSPQVPRRSVFPEAYPRVCAAFMSNGRLGLLRKSMRAFVHHMETHEPGPPPPPSLPFPAL
jgi:hypothetical protein